MNKFEIKTKIEQEFKDLSENFAVTLSIDQHIYNKSYIALLEYLMKKLHLKGLYVSLNRTYEIICEELKKNKLNINAIYCIDCASKETGKFSNSEKCFCLDDPSSLTELSFLIRTLCDEKKIKFIVLNSLTTLLLYNDIEAVEKFVHSLVNKARKSNVSTAIMSPKEKSKEDVLADITQYCDKEIEL